MTKTTPVSVDPAEVLDAINGIVGTQERIHGALTAMGNDGAQTILTFANTQAKPSEHAVIAPDKDDGPDIPDGSVKVCAGTIFIADVETPSTASRAS